ncbi:hypothetical protein PUN28_019769 [Cardiocondyla obscurior]|uniref:MULE domain-containing protein n=1 Tax=Cardiocondyla obscurior TaxID=286306 RepID=A0AAW2ECP5_9HYME
MTRCLIASINYFPILYVPFKSGMLLLTNILNINMTHLKTTLSYTEWMTYNFYKFLFYGMKFPSVRKMVNKIIHYIVYTAENYDKKKLNNIHEKSIKLLPDFSIAY